MHEDKSMRDGPGPSTRILVCMGPGGVGKTTCAAALAMAFAAAGRRVAVVTIDPSHRLAQALGLVGGAATPGVLNPVSLPEGTGRLDALLLDTATVFDALVRDGSEDEARARAMLDNPIYQATSRYLGGALEYAAMARLQMLFEAGTHDLIVLDTPPAANALEFLDAPDKVRGLIDNPAARVVLSGGRVGGRLLGLGVRTLMKLLGRMGGADFLRDLSVFLTEFAGIIEAFHIRGAAFQDELRGPRTSALVVTSTANFSVAESLDFIAELRRFGMRVSAAVVNRVSSDPGPAVPTQTLRAWAAEAADATLDGERFAQWVTRAHEGIAAAHARSIDACDRIEAAFPGVRAVRATRTTPPPESVEALLDFGRALHRDVFGTEAAARSSDP